jgi:hypothetical protein
MIIPFQIPNSIHTNRQFCTVLNNPYLKHIDSFSLEVYHDNKKVKAGIDKDTQNQGNTETYYSNEINEDKSYDHEINDDILLLYDDAGVNYAHFFFDFFGKCLYFKEVKKQYPNLKIGILEDFYLETGNSTFIKQWLKLYFEENIEIIVFNKDQRYKIKTLILPNSFYWFPEGYGDDYILEEIVKTVEKIPLIETKSKGCYISRQDIVKREWHNKRHLVNEVNLIESIQNELGYDIIELMDYDMIGKIQIFKSYDFIIQQSSASNVSLLFSNKKNTNVIISHPIMENWLNFKCQQFSQKSKTNLITLNGGGELSTGYDEKLIDQNNYPWRLVDIEGVIKILKQIDNGDI